MRTLDRILLLVVIVGCAVLAMHTADGGGSRFFLTSAVAYSVYAFIGAAGVAFYWILQRPWSRYGQWALRCVVTVLGLLVAVPAIRVVPTFFIPRGPSDALGTDDSFDFARFRPRDRAYWALRLALHGATTFPGGDTIPTIAESWPVPPDARMTARRIDANSVEFRARAGAVACEAVLVDGVPRSTSTTGAEHEGAAVRCSRAEESTGPWIAARRLPLAASAARLVPGPSRWMQYRQSADRLGGVDSAREESPEWQTTVVGPLRATPSASAGRVFIGSHDTGVLTALNAGTGATLWRATVPSWIHQDAVSDGAIVAVGFGDNELSRTGFAPSGVAVFDAAKGSLLWTALEHGSVMTSPIISGDEIIYGTSKGVIQKRSRLDGRLIETMQLEGGPVMGSPLLVGDTLVLAVDGNRVCSGHRQPLQVIWCRTIPDLQDVGDIAPSVMDSIVVVSGNLLSNRRTWWTVVTDEAPFARKFAYSISVLARPSRLIGQVYFGLSLRDGRMLWHSPIYFSRRPVAGHTSGTAVRVGPAAAMVLPTADTIVAFSPADGRMIWTAGAGGSRAPLLAAGANVYVTDRDGTLRVIDGKTGTVICSSKLGSGYDRSGPIRVAGSLVAADVGGAIASVPLVKASACSVTQRR